MRAHLDTLPETNVFKVESSPLAGCCARIELQLQSQELSELRDS